MESQIEIFDPGLISIDDLLHKTLPRYSVSLNDLGVSLPRNKGVVQQYKWCFTIDRSLDVVAAYFNDEKAIEILAEIGKPSLRQFGLQQSEKFDVGAKGFYWIKKPLTIAKGNFIITHKGLYGAVLRLGYIRLEDLRKNPAFLGMLDMSEFGFSIFEFCQTADKTTSGSYFIAQQLPGHTWGKPLERLLRKKLNNPSFFTAFTRLKKNIECYYPSE